MEEGDLRIEISREREGRKGTCLEKQKGFGYICKAKARPSDTSMTDLLGNDAFTEAILCSLRGTKVGKVKERALMNDRIGVVVFFSFPFFSFHFFSLLSFTFLLPSVVHASVY